MIARLERLGKLSIARLKLGKLVTSVPILLIFGYSALFVTIVCLVVSGRGPSRAQFAELAQSSAGVGDSAAVPWLIFIFNPRDCPLCLRLGRYWSALHRSGVVEVNGFMVGAPQNPDSVQAFLASQGIEYPVDADPDEQLVSAVAGLGYDSTPVAILFDKRHRPRLIIPPLRDSIAQIEHIRLVEAQLAQLRSAQ